MVNPLLRAPYADIRDDASEPAKLLAQTWFDDLLTALPVVVAIYALDWLTNRAVGGQIFKAFEALVEMRSRFHMLGTRLEPRPPGASPNRPAVADADQASQGSPNNDLPGEA